METDIRFQMHLFTITTTVTVCSITMIIYRKEIPFFDDRAKWEGSRGGYVLGKMKVECARIKTLGFPASDADICR